MKRQTFLKSMLCLLIAMLCLPMAMQAKVEHLLPKVHSLVETKGMPFALKRAVSITDANNTAALKKVFADNGCTIEQGASATVTVQMVESIEGAYDYTLEGYDNEGYQLSVTENEIVIKAVKPIGVIRAAQTLAQLAEGYEEGQAAIETVEITDWAAFKLRGYMHDVGRSFISVEELKKHIDLLSRFKVNTFHWHFTENQAWRFEVEGYPQLTSTESMTRFAGKYYTQAECREVAQYAHERGVTIIPEIDMPGHSEAFHRAMGFDMQTDEGVDVLKKVLTQVAAVFPNAPYIHIGADEKGITYPNFLGIMADHIHGLGRKMIVWNPISGVAINSTMCDMTQMWSSSGANINGVPDIDCRYNYTNHFDVFADVVGIYKSNIYYADKGSSEIAGTISAYWNDRKTPTEEDIVKQNNMYANVLASAERAWIGSKVNGAEGYIEKLGTTLPNSGEVYEEFKSWEERFLFHKAHSLKNEPIPYVKQTNVRWRITDPFPNGGNSGATFAPDQYATSTNDEGLIPETFTHEGKTYYTGMATGAGIYLRHVWGNNIIPTYYGSTNHSNMTAYAWTYVYSPKAQTVGAQIEFQNYGRSEKDSAPDAGKWDRKGSDIWLNGSRINPPTWDNTGKGINNEVDLLNENFTARNPIEVQLNEGWNKVFIKLPYVGAGGVRLNKWMFTCVFTDLEGKNAVEGLIYSPNQCIDEATELVAAEISNIKRNRSNYIGTAVGLWPESAAATLDAKVKEVEATYTSTMTEAERKAQAAALQTAWADFVASLANVEINQPVSGNYYRMYTPLRASRYATGNGADAAITGPTEAATKASIWQFVKRSDNAYNIINLADGTYISPASNNNTALKTVTAQPETGWTIKKAETTGNVIVVSGSVQFNQQKDGNLHLLNWGSGTNTTDDGCEYRFVDVTSIAPATPIKLLANAEELGNGNIYTFVTKRGWMGATANSNNVISTARTTVEPAAAGDNPYFQWTVYKSDNNKYYLYNLGKKQFMGVQSSNNASIPFAAQPAGKALTFKQSSSTDYPIMFSTDNAGVANHSPNHGDGLITWTGGWNTLNDEGSNHQVALISKLPETTLQEIAAIVADYEFDDVVIESAEKLKNGGVYTFETPRGWVGANEGNTAIGTVKTSVTPAPSNANIMFQWALYQSEKGYYYLYNLGKQQFLGVPANGAFPFVDTPTGKNLTFKNNGKTDYPIMFSTDNRHAVSQNANAGLFAWEGGWNNMNDDGSNHKVTHVSMLPEATLQDIAAIVDEYEFEGEPITGVEKFVSGGIYNFETTRGWMGATENCDNVISTAKTSHGVTGTAKNPMFQWVVYQSNNGNYYLYNLGKQMFMGVQSSNNASIPFTAQPAGKKLTFKQSSSDEYPIMFSTDNAGVANHSDSYGDGLITWTGGWNKLDDGGSNHKVSYIGSLTADQLKSISDLVETYDKRLYVTATVEGSWENNPNTHFGSVRATSTSGTLTTKLKRDEDVVMLDYNGLEETTIDFTREYRGFEFQGFKLGEQELGKSFTLTEEQETNITAENPLVAKFTTTEAVTLFYDDDASSYRIPAIATTSTGRLIAVSDYRHCLDDIGLNRYGKGYRIDLVIRTSDDNGKTWSNIQTIAEGIDNSQANDCAYGDAAIAVVGEEVIVMAVAGSVSYGKGSAGSETEPKKTSRLVRIYSNNNGKNWVKEDITEKVYGYEGSLYPNVYTAFFGSGRLAVEPNFNESGKARIYGSMLTQGMGNIVIYSDDMGLTWNKLGGQVANANEPKIEILPSGQILFSARRNGGRNFNVFTYTNKANNEGTWSNAVNGCDNEGQNGTNGETFLIDAKNARGENVKLLLQSQPVGGGVWDRANVSIWYKEISSTENHNHTPNEIASGWTKGLQVSHQLSAYSAMSLQKDGRIAFFFEEAPCYQDNYNYGYCMVYMPLTIDQITKGNYFAPEADLNTVAAINVVLTDAQGNEYRDQVQSTVTGVATALTTKYPFITLGDTPSLESDGTTFTYTNTVTLPFKVSNAETTVWHNIYWSSNTNENGYPIYLSAGGASDTNVGKVTEKVQYGNSSFNTADYAAKISWAVYSVNNGFTFKFKNQLTGKFIQVTSVASGNSENAKYVDEDNATAFELIPDAASYYGDYALKAVVNDTEGYLCSTSASYGYATHYKGTNHQGAWLKFVEAPDFAVLIAEVNAVLNMFGNGIGQYSNISNENLRDINEAKTAMENASVVKLNTLNTYKSYTSKTSGGTLNLPTAGQFFRIRGISGNYIDGTSLYNATTGQMAMKSAEECNYNGTIFYLDDEGHLLNYATGTYVKQTREIGAVGDSDKGVWTFAESPRTGKGKYQLSCSVGVTGNGQNLHDSDGNRADRCRSNCGERHDFTLEEVDALPITISAIGYATLYTPVALIVPEDVKAYTGLLNETRDKLTLKRVQVIPGNTGVVLYREEGTEATNHEFEITSDVEAVNSDFVGSVATTAKSGTPYTLQTHDYDKDGTKESVAFKMYTGTNPINGFKAYLDLTEQSSEEAQAISIHFASDEDNEGGTTSVEGPVANGQQPTAIYDLLGRRVEKMEKGIYIVNGKKVVIK